MKMSEKARTRLINITGILMFIMLVGLLCSVLLNLSGSKAEGGEESMEDVGAVSVEETEHRVQFSAQITLGGEVILKWSDRIAWADDIAFNKWFEQLTIKEIREKYGFDFTKYRVIEDKEKS